MPAVDGDAADIPREAGAQEPPPHGQAPGAKADRPLERPAAVADQMVAGLASPAVAVAIHGGFRSDDQARRATSGSSSAVPRAICSMAVR